MSRRDLPAVLFELSIMTETVRNFGPDAGQQETADLLSRLALLESKALRLIDLGSADDRGGAKGSH